MNGFILGLCAGGIALDWFPCTFIVWARVKLSLGGDSVSTSPFEAYLRLACLTGGLGSEYRSAVEIFLLRWREGGEGSEYRSAVETVLRREGGFFVIVVVA
jgi:hypothetical protein